MKNLNFYLHLILDRIDTNKFETLNEKYFLQYWKAVETDIEYFRIPDNTTILYYKNIAYKQSYNFLKCWLTEYLSQLLLDKPDILVIKPLSFLDSEFSLTKYEYVKVDALKIKIEQKLTDKYLIKILTKIAEYCNNKLLELIIREVYELSFGLIFHSDPFSMAKTLEENENKRRTFPIKLLREIKKIETTTFPKPTQIKCLILANKNLKIYDEDDLIDVKTKKMKPFANNIIKAYKTQKKKL
jgi:hypothetical protein